MRNVLVSWLLLLFVCVFPANAGDIREAGELAALLSQNKTNFERTFFQQVVTVRGYVLNAGPSIYATPKVELAAESGGKHVLTCILPRADFAKLADLTVGEPVVFTGSYRGLRGNGSIILLKECVIVDR